MPQNPKVLIVDDMQAILVMYNSLLSNQGFEVLTASNGNDCLRLAKQFHPDIILLDIMMPKMDGGMTAGLLLEDPATKNIPIIFLTSMVSEEEAVAQNNNPNGRQFLSKSTPPTAILAKIRETLGL
ncbi:MAG: response regulator [Elusimicrobia bacterium]|nr:response regulator [Elusimicrobiota bacterium]